jgi:hypothetical protein
MIDVLLQLILAAALALLFAAAALHKWRSGPFFEAQLAEYRLLPEALVPVAARALALLELALALGLLVPATRPLAGAAAAGLLALYGGAIAVNLVRGRDWIDCGCGDTPVLLTPWLLLRNGVLVLGALLVALPAQARPLGWTDLLLGVPALLVLVVAWALVEQLLENASVLREWSQARD